MRFKSMLKYGSCFAVFRLAILWFVVDVARNSSGLAQAVGYLSQISLMLPECLIARDARNNISAWTTKMVFLLTMSSYLYFLVLWIVVRLLPLDEPLPE